ncbi:hypothetical protein OESDEN_04697 [Oesophagostomum dentatum]|uniref:Uncharacterized protein n=1 Tax=Oesophagostomum dentatum TaxID=61180 RepID=A0A0B1TCR9_OESDE|nr:hypothetical protein OESDEN_04697 [Oesophagostomum dentatum]
MRDEQKAGYSGNFRKFCGKQQKIDRRNDHKAAI